MKPLAIALVLTASLLGGSARADGDPADDTPALDASRTDEAPPADPIDADAEQPPQEDPERDPHVNDDPDDEQGAAIHEPLIDEVPPPTADQLPEARKTMREATPPTPTTPTPTTRVRPWRPNAWQQSGAVATSAAVGVLLAGVPFGVLVSAAALLVPAVNLMRGLDPFSTTVLTGDAAVLQGYLTVAAVLSVLATPLVMMFGTGLLSFLSGWLLGDLAEGAGAAAAGAIALIPAMFPCAVVTTLAILGAWLALIGVGTALSVGTNPVVAVVVLVGWPVLFLALEGAVAGLAALGGYWGVSYALSSDPSEDADRRFYELDDPDTDLLPDSSFDLRASPALVE